MISYIKGKITEKNLENKTFVIENSGLGYLIKSNLKELGQLQLEQELKIYTSQQQENEKPTLYGFHSRGIRDIFEILISVSGVGPKAGLNILECLETEQLISAVIREEHKLIAEAKGIGPKTAKRIILELSNKLVKLKAYKGMQMQDAAQKAAPEVSNILSNLGFSLAEIDLKLKAAADAQVEDDPELLIKYCLQN